MTRHGNAAIYRMVMDKHVCPWGLRAVDLLKRHGYAVEDHHLTSRDATDAFKRQHDVRTTPQIFIDGRRIGGHDDLRRHLGLSVRDPKATTYRPVIALFAMALAMSAAIGWTAEGMIAPVMLVERFIAASMCLLALQKLRDVDSFATMFLGYDLLAARWVRYGWIYPWAEGVAGVLMLAGALTWIAAPVALVIGGIGAVSVFKAVYLDRRELKCACVGGDSNVPLGFVSLTENVMMAAMAVWMLVR
ncbi:glutaredoxin [Sphingomonas sp.]|uniref:glutaredoxin n=1 Tax=Sphingomonas sp. TaxID=28214 RepID=UPI002C58B284|nr:glutaredoxin [Sphingomonas sp.]HTG37987.1 glutaredoxin [Sphingomonas sp.]